MMSIIELIFGISVLIFIWLAITSSKKQQNNICLFLDDERNPEDVTWISYPANIEFVVVRNYAEFVAYLNENEIPSFISFDHDLADFNEAREGLYKERTGHDCVKYFCNHFADSDKFIEHFPETFYHTNNVIGKTNMESYVNNFKKVMK